MFNKGQLEGILLSLAKPEIHTSRANDTNLGYRVRVRVNFRGNAPFLKALSRTFEQKKISHTYKDKEHKSRPRPILSIGGIVNLWKLCELVPDALPDARASWKNFREIIKIIDDGEHHTLEGLERILELKGEL